jgi:hypothetical protein
VIASSVQATSKLIFADCSCSNVGSNTKFHSKSPTIFTPATGPSNGAPDIISARDAQVIPRNPRSDSFELLKAVAIICVSLIKPFGNIGRIGLSINLEVRTEASLGLPSLFINLFPPIFHVA